MFDKEEQEAFLRHIADNEEDESRRLIYADWLDENGMEDEATRQRKWKMARDWILSFAKRWNFFDCTGSEGDFVVNWELPYDHPDKYNTIPGVVIPDKEIISRIVAAANSIPNDDSEWDGWEGLTAMGIDLHGAEELREGEEEKFWESLEIVTGTRYTENVRKEFGWSCSC